MKASNSVPTTAASASSNRRQPVRQTRTNPVRNSTTSSRQFGAQGSAGGLDNGHDDGTAPGFFPAITHFTNSISAFPKEIIKHFTLLKEVDAKAYGPDEALGHLVEAALNAPAPPRKQTISYTQASEAPAISGGTNNQTTSGILPKGNAPGSQASQADPESTSQLQPADDDSTLPRRHLFLNLRLVLTEMLMTLDEKNHVISTATDAMNKQLARINSSFPYIENEISEEARLGSTTHWANPKPLVDKPTTTTANERSRREPRNFQDIVAASNLAAALVKEDQAAASRSESRREAMLAKKTRNPRADSELDDGHGRNRDAGSIQSTTAVKRPHGNTKARKVADGGSAVNGSTVGLGITNGNTGASINPPSKRRKTEKAANNTSNGPIAMERSMSAVMNVSNAKAAAGSPRETPVTEGGRKRARGGGAAGVTRKRNNTITSTTKNSPSLASSPVHGTFAAAKDQHRSSPAPRLQSSRARQSSTHSIVPDGQPSNTRRRPSSSGSNRPNSLNGISASTTDVNSVAGLTGRSIPDVKSNMQDTLNSKGERMIEDSHPESTSTELRGALVINSTKANSAATSLKKEDTDINNNTTTTTLKSVEQQPTSSNTSTTTTRHATKTSKTSTPTTSTFPPSPAPRSRSSRAQLDPPPTSSTTTATKTKRSHKKGAGLAARQQAANAPVTNNHLSNNAIDNDDDAGGGGGGGASADDEEDEEDDESEPRYCYCNQVSYGEMVACDADDCPREWFHLVCVGLTKAPKGNGELF
ncbi:MAG: hypothetical protein M1835_004220 [Candelina submexicana]|nr:MAG: hypothetical protein M1835_004220 [Candelina submexicana]